MLRILLIVFLLDHCYCYFYRYHHLSNINFPSLLPPYRFNNRVQKINEHSVENVFEIESSVFKLLQTLETSTLENKQIYNELLKDCAETGNTKVAEAIIRQMNILDVVFSQHTYEFLIKSYLNDKSLIFLSAVDEAEIVFKELLRSGHCPSISICTDIIKALGEAKLPERAELIFNKISLLNCLDMDNVEIYNSLLAVWSHQCDKRIDAFAKTEEILQRMNYIELLPNIHTYEYILQGLLLSRRQEEHSSSTVNSAKKAYDIYRSMLVNIDQSHVTLKIYEYIYQLCALDSFHSLLLCKAIVLDLSNDMKQKNVPISLNCYISALQVYSHDYTNDYSAQMVSEIYHIIYANHTSQYEEHLNKSVSNYDHLNLRTKIALFWARYSCSANRNPLIYDATTRALSIVSAMHESNPTIFASVDCYVYLIRALGKENNMQSIEKYIIDPFVTQYYAINDHNKLIVSDIKIWNEVISSYYISSSKSISLISEATKTNLSVHNVISHAWSYDNHNNNLQKQPLHSNDNTIKITDSSQIQLQNALDRQAVTQTQLINNVEKVLKVLKSLNVATDSKTYSILSSIFAKAGDFERIKDLISEMRLRNQTIPQVVYKSFISQLLKSFPSNQIKQQHMNLNISDNNMDSEIELVTKNFKEMCGSYIEERNIANANLFERHEGIIPIEQSFKEMLSTSNFKPDLRIFNSYLNALAIASTSVPLSSHSRLSIPISLIHSSIDETSLKYSNGSTPNIFTFDHSAENNEHSLNTRTSLGDNAISVFQDMKKYNISPTTESYGLLLRAMEGDLEVGRNMIPDRALEIVQYMIASSGSIDLTPTVDIFETLIRIWVCSKRPDAARVTESIYRTFRSINAAAFDNNSYSNTSKYIHHSEHHPNTTIIAEFRNFNIHTLLLEVWAKSNLPNAGTKAEDILENFVLFGLKPSSHMFSLIARSWSKFASVSTKAIPTNTPPSKVGLLVHPRSSSTSRFISPRQKYLRNRRASYDNSLIEFDLSNTNSNISVKLQMQADYIENCFIRCIANGLLPEASLYRSLLSAWCQEGSETSISNVETVLERVSFLSNMNEDKEKYLPLNISSKLIIPVLVDGLNISSIHPSIYTLLASAWKHPVDDSYNFLNRLKRAGATGQQLYIAYNLVLAAYSLQSNSEINVIMSEKFYRESLQVTKSTAGPQLDITATNYLLDCIINSNWNENIVYEKCSEIIDLSNKILKSQPNDYTVYLMLRCWKERDCKVIPERALLLFDSMKQYPGFSFHIHRNSFVSYIEILSSNFPMISARLLNYLLSINFIPSSNVFSLVLYGASECKLLDLSIELLDKMLKFGYKPDFYSSRSLLIALAGTKNGIHATIVAERIDQVFTKMLNSGVRTTEEMLVLVLQAWLSSRSPHSSSRATEIFRKAMKLNANPPSVRLYNILMNIHGKAQLNNPNASPLTSEKILLYEMKENGVEPDTVSYNTVISAWGKSSHFNASIRAFNLFTLAKDSNLNLNVITYTSLLSALSKANNASIYSILQSIPNLITHKEISNKIAIAEYILKEMQLAGIEPDKMVWNILIGIWCNNYNANKEENVQKVFERMLNNGCEPTTVTYTTMLTMWASSKLPIASKSIVEIFKRMQQEGQKSDTISYSSLLSAIGKTSDPEAPIKALAVFDAMIASGIKADTTAWTILIEIWSRSKIPGKEDKILEFYDLMRKPESNCVPNSVTYTTMLEMWVRSKHQNATVHIMSLYNEIMNKNVFLDGYAFSKLIPALQKAYKNLKPHKDLIFSTKLDGDKLALNKAEELLMHMVNYKLLPDVLAWNSIMKSDTSHYNDVRILRLYSVMNSLGITGNKKTYDMVLYAIDKSIRYDKILCDKTEQMNKIKVALLILDRMYLGGMLSDSKAINTVLISLSRCSHNDALNVTNDIYKKYIQSSRSGSNNIIPDNFTANAIMRTYIRDGIFDSHSENEPNIRFAQVKDIEVIITDIIYKNINSLTTTSNQVNIVDISLFNDLLVLWKRSTYLANHPTTIGSDLFSPITRNTSKIASQLSHYEYVLLYIEHLFKYCTVEYSEDHIYIDDAFNIIETSPLLSILKERQENLIKVQPDNKTYEEYFQFCLRYLQIILAQRESYRSTDSYFVPKIDISQRLKSLKLKILNKKNEIQNSISRVSLFSSNKDDTLIFLIEQIVKRIEMLGIT